MPPTDLQNKTTHFREKELELHKGRECSLNSTLSCPVPVWIFGSRFHSTDQFFFVSCPHPPPPVRDSQMAQCPPRSEPPASAHSVEERKTPAFMLTIPGTDP